MFDDVLIRKDGGFRTERTRAAEPRELGISLIRGTRKAGDGFRQDQDAWWQCRSQSCLQELKRTAVRKSATIPSTKPISADGVYGKLDDRHTIHSASVLHTTIFSGQDGEYRASIVLFLLLYISAVYHHLLAEKRPAEETMFRILSDFFPCGFRRHLRRIVPAPHNLPTFTDVSIHLTTGACRFCRCFRPF